MEAPSPFDASGLLVCVMLVPLVRLSDDWQPEIVLNNITHKQLPVNHQGRMQDRMLLLFVF